MLIGRTNEKLLLEEALSSNRSELVVVYGRRRVGKTYLIKQVLGEQIDFEMTGIKDGDMNDQLENFTTKLSERGFGQIGTEKPKNWMKAFSLLKGFLMTIPKEKKKVIFLDELSWIHTHKSKFLGMLGHFWNDWALYNNVVIVVCGSAASWMINKVLNDKGGLHNRATQYIPLQPFTLSESEQFLEAKNIKATRYQVVQLYMALGGIPYYLDLLKPSESIIQNIDRLCFSQSGFLRDEFNRVFNSLFETAENHMLIVKALSSKWKGLNRAEIVAITKIKNGGSLTRFLDELEKSAFIKTYYPFNKKKKGMLYRLTDNFSLFFLKLISQRNLLNQTNVFLKLFTTPSYNSWSGYAFENICLIHHQQIAQALGIAYIFHEFSSFQFPGNQELKGIQIDLLIDRADGIINLCEIKFANVDYNLTASYAQTLKERSAIFSTVTKIKKAVFTTLITTYGMVDAKHHTDVVQNVVTMDHLFVRNV